MISVFLTPIYAFKLINYYSIIHNKNSLTKCIHSITNILPQISRNKAKIKTHYVTINRLNITKSDVIERIYRKSLKILRQEVMKMTD